LVLKVIEFSFDKAPDYYFKNGLFTSSLAMIFTAMEYFIPQQFPVMLGQPWIVLSEYLGAASYLGLPIFSFMSYLLCFEIIKAIQHKRLSYINLISLLIFIFINPFLVTRDRPKLEKEINIRLVQANISNFLKVDSETGGYASTQQVLSRYETLSVAPFKDNKPIDLIVWPETAYPYPINTNKLDISKTLVPNLFTQIINKTHSALFTGGYDHFKNNSSGSYFKTEYNAGLYVNTNGILDSVYHKHILIPFGETLPLGPFNEWASQKFPEMAFFAEGSSYPIFNTDKNIKFISSICYEILRPEFFRSYLNALSEKPHVMINLTNDSWYGNTVEPEQHLFLARWRAIEFNIPILRSTNTGISTFIQSNGQEHSRLEYGVTGNLDLSIKFPQISEKDSRTFFQRFGFLAILPLWLLYFIFHITLIRLEHD
jgi:apolipoprotein N-acyltransferase